MPPWRIPVDPQGEAEDDVDAEDATDAKDDAKEDAKDTKDDAKDAKDYARRQPRRMQKICHSERIGSSFWNSNPAHRVITIGSLLLSPCTFIDSYNC